MGLMAGELGLQSVVWDGISTVFSDRGFDREVAVVFIRDILTIAGR